MFMFAMLLILEGFASESWACMCMPAHPQENICRKESFAILVKIRHEEQVRIASAGTMPSKRWIESTLEGKLESPRKNFNHTNVERRKLFSTPTFFEERKHMNADHIRYHVKVYKVFKGIFDDANPNMKHYIYTPSQGSLCGKKLQSKKTYLIIGSIIDGRLSFGLCDDVMEWKSLSQLEKRNIRDNMVHTELMCDSGCNVTSCMWSECKPQSDHQCTWNSDMERRYGQKFHRLNFICIPTIKHGCDWAGSVVSNINKQSRRRRYNKLIEPGTAAR